MRMLINLLFSLLILACFTGAAASATIDDTTNITIFDQNRGNSKNWYGKDGQHEDNEVEPGMLANQSWDLEGFFLDETSLYMVGGYDFVDGNDGFDSGDIFIDVDGNAQFGDIHRPNGSTNGVQTVNNTFGYDYVLDMDFDNLTYNLFSIDTSSQVKTSYYKQNQGSNPWRYVDDGTKLNDDAKTFGYNKADTDAAAYFDDGDLHNLVMVDVGFLSELGLSKDTLITYHFTMGCGNDNLMGRATIPNPEPGTMILLGFGLLGLAGLGRRTLNKK